MQAALWAVGLVVLVAPVGLVHFAFVYLSTGTNATNEVEPPGSGYAKRIYILNSTERVRVGIVCD